MHVLLDLLTLCDGLCVAPACCVSLPVLVAYMSLPGTPHPPLGGKRAAPLSEGVGSMPYSHSKLSNKTQQMYKTGKT